MFVSGFFAGLLEQGCRLGVPGPWRPALRVERRKSSRSGGKKGKPMTHSMVVVGKHWKHVCLLWFSG